MSSKSLHSAVFVTALLALAKIASAHPGHGAANGFAAGAFHPFSGIDHVLAMVAVGICAAQIGGRVIWLLPATFLAFVIGGGIMGIGAAPLPMIEHGIAASVLVLGLLVAFNSKFYRPLIFGLVALFAVFHGYAHGSEMHPGLGPMAYAAGFVLATAALLGIGIVAGMAAKRAAWTPLWRLAGGAIAVCGILLFWM
jgi:urease accessory protein